MPNSSMACPMFFGGVLPAETVQAENDAKSHHLHQNKKQHHSLV
jgi:hypothetical protein